VKTGWFFLLAAAASAQTLTVYSEFARIDAQGKVTAPESPREILSPAIARNGLSSFQIVVDVPAGTAYELWIAQNPSNAVRVTLYRESGDQLTKVGMPAKGDSTQVFWMDLSAGLDAPVQRVKVEPQLNVNKDWVIYPMEVRIMKATVPDGDWPPGTAPPVEVMRGFLCGTRTWNSSSSHEPSVPALRFRNALEDVALAQDLPRTERAGLQQRFGSCTAPASSDPEWYYRIRDYLLNPQQ
jgi:hypothetical protein